MRSWHLMKKLASFWKSQGHMKKSGSYEKVSALLKCTHAIELSALYEKVIAL